MLRPAPACLTWACPSGLVWAVPSAYTSVGTVWLPSLAAITTSAALGVPLDVDHVVADAFAVQLALQAVAVATPRGRVHREGPGGRTGPGVGAHSCPLSRLRSSPTQHHRDGEHFRCMRTIYSVRSTRSSVRSPPRCVVPSACWPARAPARPARSPIASPTASRRASTTRQRSWPSPSPRERPARCGPACAPWRRVPCRPARSTPRPCDRCATSGRRSTAAPRPS